VPTVVNLQRKIPVKSSSFHPFLETLFGSVDEATGKDIAVAFISDRRMVQLNSFFRGRDSTTDVLSFPHEADEFEVLSTDLGQLESTTPSAETAATPPNQGGQLKNFIGDIVISVEQAARQADENGLTLENEIKQLILHGLLHLCGYDHETDDGKMNRRELELRDKLGI
jgi:probable rRNA maturation factor